MIEPRVYRAAFVPAVLALVLVMFSLGDGPPPLPQGLAADVVFDEDLVQEELAAIVAAAPDRRPGTPGDLRTGARVADFFAAQGFDTRRDLFSERGRPLMNVLATRTGASRRQIVVLAARDAGSVPDATGSAADTAALLELGRVLEGRVTERTIVLASVDGSRLGQAGVRRLLDQQSASDPIEAVVVLRGMGAPENRGPRVLAWSNESERSSLGLMRTAVESLREETGRPAGGDGVLAQLARLAFPVAVGPTGVLLARDEEAITFAGAGELGPPPGQRGLEDVNPVRMGALGRAASRTIAALDASRAPDHGPRAYLTVSNQVLSEAAVRLLALGLLLPALVAAVDGFARARRRREPVVTALGALGWGTVALLAGLAAALLAAVAGLAPSPGGAPPDPHAIPLQGSAALVAGLAVLAATATWLAGRRLLPPPWGGPLDPARPAIGAAVAVVLVAAAIALWVVNPFAALVAVPAVHFWLIAALGSRRPGPGSALLVAAGLIAPALALAHYLARWELDPLSGLWYAYALVAGGHVGVVSLVLLALLGAVLVAVVVALVARALNPPPRPARRVPPPRPAIRGPGGHVGPGALGGPRSAGRR